MPLHIYFIKINAEQGVSSKRSFACNPKFISACNYFRKKMHVINPKKRECKAYALMTYSLRCKLITYAYRRLHTNPADWIKKERSLHFVLFLVRIMGLEPIRRLTHAPQTCLSAYSSTSALLFAPTERNHYIIEQKECQ